jgi:hypothetical protein
MHLEAILSSLDKGSILTQVLCTAACGALAQEESLEMAA